MPLVSPRPRDPRSVIQERLQEPSQPLQGHRRPQRYCRATAARRRWETLVAARAPIEMACCGAWHDARGACPTCGRRHLVLLEVTHAA